MFFGEELELALLGDVAGLAEAKNCLLASGMGLPGNDATLVHHEVTLLETARRVVRRAVHDLDAGADGHVAAARLTTRHVVLAAHVVAVLAAHVVHAALVHVVHVVHSVSTE